MLINLPPDLVSPFSSPTSFKLAHWLAKKHSPTPERKPTNNTPSPLSMGSTLISTPLSSVQVPTHPPACTPSSRSTKQDIMNDFHAATKHDQELNEKETEYGHIEGMAQIAAKHQKDKAKFEMKWAQLENERL